MGFNQPPDGAGGYGSRRVGAVLGSLRGVDGFSGSSELSVGERVLVGVGGWGDLLKVTGAWWWR